MSFWPSYILPPINLWNVWNMIDSASSSPCIKKCLLDSDRKICLGCGRTPLEIEEWTLYNSREQRDIRLLAKQRLQTQLSNKNEIHNNINDN
jgi:uncharacterized protein